MEQHPVPQHIASYEFRLVGDMTLKQFGLLAGCCVIALIFYGTHIPAIFKWPLILFWVLLGVGLAFFPMQERPLHQWIIAFFKAIYSPTYFVWKKQPQSLEFLNTPPRLQPTTPSQKQPAPDEEQLTEYIQTLPEEKPPLEQDEKQFIEKVGLLFQADHVQIQPNTISSMPDFSQPAPTPIAPAPQTIRVTTTEATPDPIRPKTVILKQEYSLPTKEKISLTQPAGFRKPTSAYSPLPQTPKSSNLLVGMAQDRDGKILESVIVEIRSSQGIPVRALKTNRLGQFLTVTPLPNDTYEIESEKEGYTFDIIKIELSGQPVPPIEIRAR